VEGFKLKIKEKDTPFTNISLPAPSQTRSKLTRGKIPEKKECGFDWKRGSDGKFWVGRKQGNLGWCQKNWAKMLV